MRCSAGCGSGRVAGMIQYLLLQNRQGKTRLSKYYRPYSDDEKHKLEGEIHRLVTTRDPKFTNFVEVFTPRGPPRARPPGLTADMHRRSTANTSSSTADTPGCSSHFAWCAPPTSPSLLRATLDEARAVPQDTTDNELMYFESIHLFVELL